MVLSEAKTEVAAPSTFEKILSKVTPMSQGVLRKVTPDLAVAEDGLNPAISVAGHAIMTLVFFGVLIAYIITSFVTYFDRPVVEVFSQLPAAQFGSHDLTISYSCTNRPFCGIVTITGNYSAPVDGCTTAASSQIVYPAAQAQATPAPVTLCYVPDQIFPIDTNALMVQGITVDFSAINPGNNKTTGIDDPSLKASSSLLIEAKDRSLKRIINLDTWQVKTLVLSLQVTRNEGVVTGKRLVATTVQYEGKRTNWRATLVVNLSPIAMVTDRSRPGTVLEVLASIGGAVSIIMAVLVFGIAPIMKLVFPGPASQAAAGAPVDEPMTDSSDPTAAHGDSTTA